MGSQYDGQGARRLLAELDEAILELRGLARYAHDLGGKKPRIALPYARIPRRNRWRDCGRNQVTYRMVCCPRSRAAKLYNSHMPKSSNRT